MKRSLVNYSMGDSSSSSQLSSESDVDVGVGSEQYAVSIAQHHQRHMYQPDERVFKKLRIEEPDMEMSENGNVMSNSQLMKQCPSVVDAEDQNIQSENGQVWNPNGEYNYNPVNHMLGRLHYESRQRKEKEAMRNREQPRYVYLNGHRYAYGSKHCHKK